VPQSPITFLVRQRDNAVWNILDVMAPIAKALRRKRPTLADSGTAAFERQYRQMSMRLRESCGRRHATVFF
jgi:hypothetical protein